MTDRKTADELVNEVRVMLASERLLTAAPAKRDAAIREYLTRYKWLGEFADTTKAAAFLGLSVESVRTYHTQGTSRRRAGYSGWMWPEPDLVVARRPAWTLATLVIARATMPGRGRGGPSTRRHYDPEFKAAATGRVLAGEPLKTVAADAGISAHTLSAWVTAARKSGD